MTTVLGLSGSLRRVSLNTGLLRAARAGGLFDADGNLTDDKTRRLVADFRAGFAASP